MDGPWAYTGPMKTLLPVALILASATLAPAQEREVPKDSTRITIPGCTRGRTFTVAAREGHAPLSAELRPGRRFRLSGPKDVLKDIEAREGTMVEVTGLVRKSDLSGPGGLTVAGGRVRIGGGAPQAQVGSGVPSGGVQDAVLDIEGWNRLPDSCR